MLFTYAVVAICVLFVAVVGVGAAGVPVKVGDARLAFVLTAVVTKAVVATCVVFVPAVAVGATGVPVKVGEASGAFSPKAVLRSVWLERVPVIEPQVPPPLPTVITEPSSVFVNNAPVLVLMAISPTTSCPAVGVVVPRLCLMTLAIDRHQKVPPSNVTPSIEPPVMDTLLDACVAIEPSPRLVLAVDAEERSDRLLEAVSLPASEFVIVVENEASFPRAAASSLRVSRAEGAEFIKLLTAVWTNAVVATCVVLVPAVAVGAAGVPVKVGEAKGAKPAMLAPEGMVTVPVKVGEAIGA